MTTRTRVYVISGPGCPVALVRASSQKAALHFKARPKYVVTVADQDRLIELLQTGVKIEEATESPTETIEIEVKPYDIPIMPAPPRKGARRVVTHVTAHAGAFKTDMADATTDGDDL